MISLKARRKRSGGIMLGPMIDMMFLLLIFFMVGTMYMSETRSIPVKLPKAAAAQLERSGDIIVTVKKDGSLWLEGRAVNKDEVLQRATAAGQSGGKKGVVIKADEDTPYKFVVALLDDLRRSGIERAGLATDKK